MTSISNEENIKHWSAVPRSLLEAFGDEGDFSRQKLLTPTIFSLLGEVQGKTIVDAGCGQGYLARQLAKRGATVIGIEPADPLIGYAIECEQMEPLGIRYIQADLSAFDDPEIVSDVVIANMVLMDIPNDQVAIENCFRILQPGGSFIFSITHPCFERNNNQNQNYFEIYEIRQQFGFAFHRPLSHYLNAVIEYGGVIQKVVEPQLKTADARPEHIQDLYFPRFIVIHAVKQR